MAEHTGILIGTTAAADPTPTFNATTQSPLDAPAATAATEATTANTAPKSPLAKQNGDD